MSELVNSEYITLDDNTFFYKKVVMHDVNDADIGFAVLRLVSIGEGILPKYDGNDRYCSLNTLSKCRFKSAKVQRLISYRCYDVDDYVHTRTPLLKCVSFVSLYNRKFKYIIGENVVPDSFDLTPITCSNGIHGFLNYSSAERYT